MSIRVNHYAELQNCPSSLASASKKIKKLPKESFAAKKAQLAYELEEVDGLLTANSDIFNKNDKMKILEELKSRISQVKGLELIYSTSGATTPGNEAIDWLKCLDKLGPDTFNTFLNDVIPQCKPRMALTKKSLVQLRRRVRSWFKSDEKHEVKGRAVVPPKELPTFVSAMKEILGEMKVKSFKELKVKVQDFLQGLYQRLGREFKGNEFSKHYWWEFQENHPVIKELWKALPQKRAKKSGTTNKKKISAMKTCDSLEDLSPSTNSMELENQSNNSTVDENLVEEPGKWSEEIDFTKLEAGFDFVDKLIMNSPVDSPAEFQEEGLIHQSEENWLADLRKEWEQSSQIAIQADLLSDFLF